jgi:hypothetical protein
VRLHEPNEVADLRSELEAAERQRDELLGLLRRPDLPEDLLVKLYALIDRETEGPAEAGQVWEREVTEHFRWGQTMPADISVGPWEVTTRPQP